MRGESIKILPDNGVDDRAELSGLMTHPGQRPGRIYPGVWCQSTAPSTMSPTANRLYALPYYVPESRTYTSINVEVTTQVLNNSMRLGIMAPLHGMPSRLILDAGSVSTAGAAIKTIGLNQRLLRGWYYLLLLSTASPALRSAIPNSQNPYSWVNGLSSNTASNTQQLMYTSYTFAALPQIWPSSGVSYENNNGPWLWLTC